MPVSRTRICPVCITEKATPADFRDPGETGAGRPPAVCAACRSTSPALRAQQAKNVEQRQAGREYREALANRSGLQVLRDQWAAHPQGMKTCPPVGGCGRRLFTAAFYINTHQVDGLSPICAECHSEAAELRRNA